MRTGGLEIGDYVYGTGDEEGTVAEIGLPEGPYHRREVRIRLEKPLDRKGKLSEWYPMHSLTTRPAGSR